MAARRHRQREGVGPGWLSTLAGAALLLVLGFGVGLLAGAAWEEPELVMDHLAGRTTELPLVAEISADPAEAEEREPASPGPWVPERVLRKPGPRSRSDLPSVWPRHPRPLARHRRRRRALRSR